MTQKTSNNDDFIKLTQESGREVYLNANNVAYIRVKQVAKGSFYDAKTGKDNVTTGAKPPTIVTTVQGHDISVQESLNDVLDALRK